MSQKERLRIAVVTTQKLWHGGEQQAGLLIEGLRERGHDCRILARTGSDFARQMITRGHDVTTFSGSGRMPGPIWRIRRMLSEWRPDILYMNDPHAVTTAGLASVGLALPARIAVRRVDFPVRNTGRYRHFCDLILCVSTAVKAACEASGLAPEKLYVVHDGVDPARMRSGDRSLARQSLGIDPQAKLCLTVARLADHKGHRYLLDAIPRVLQREPNLVFAFAGDGHLWESLRNQSRRLGIDRNVQFLGYRDDVPSLMAAADRMVIPSCLEGLCSSIIDAMLLGLPVVATTAGGIPDLLAAREDKLPCGWLAPPRDADGLAEAILNSIRFPTLTSQYAAAARRRSQHEFTADCMVDRTLGAAKSLAIVRHARIAG